MERLIRSLWCLGISTVAWTVVCMPACSHLQFFSQYQKFHYISKIPKPKMYFGPFWATLIFWPNLPPPPQKKWDNTRFGLIQIQLPSISLFISSSHFLIGPPPSLHLTFHLTLHLSLTFHILIYLFIYLSKPKLQLNYSSSTYLNQVTVKLNRHNQMKLDTTLASILVVVFYYVNLCN